jgi:hypothetical protein
MIGLAADLTLPTLLVVSGLALIVGGQSGALWL